MNDTASLRITTSYTRSELADSIHAIILAAGLGIRLGPMGEGLPKPLVSVGGIPLLERSLEVLNRTGISNISVVIGHLGDQVSRAASAICSGVSFAENTAPSTTGSMRSLALGWTSLRARPDAVLIVEGDLLYGPEAIWALQSDGGLDLILLSGLTGAGDEVWVCGEGRKISKIAKSPMTGATVLGELVGLSLISAETMDEMVATHYQGADSAVLEHYEERISALANHRTFRGVLVEDLAWAEIDDASQLRRAEEVVLPRLRGRDVG